jgi:hypothetical protein
MGSPRRDFEVGSSPWLPRCGQRLRRQPRHAERHIYATHAISRSGGGRAASLAPEVSRAHDKGSPGISQNADRQCHCGPIGAAGGWPRYLWKIQYFVGRTA